MLLFEEGEDALEVGRGRGGGLGALRPVGAQAYVVNVCSDNWLSISGLVLSPRPSICLREGDNTLLEQVVKALTDPGNRAVLQLAANFTVNCIVVARVALIIGGKSRFIPQNLIVGYFCREI